MPVARASFRMPPEWAPHERTWMAWPGPNPTFASDAELAEARRAWAGVARAVRRFEPVTMVVGPGQEEGAAALLGPDVELVVRPLDDAWTRDVGPTFVTDGRTLAAVDWTFNGLGAQGWARREHDQHTARAVAEPAGAPAHSSPLVNEGGAIHVDGEGTVLLTETVQLGAERNAGWTREQVEAEVHARLGTEKSIWLPRGLTGDYGTYGTLGHVDIAAAMATVAERGLDGLTMAGLGREVGMSSGHLLYYFRTKDELLPAHGPSPGSRPSHGC